MMATDLISARLIRGPVGTGAPETLSQRRLYGV